jgi:hypothetical protein
MKVEMILDSLKGLLYLRLYQRNDREDIGEDLPEQAERVKRVSRKKTGD